MRAGKAQLQCFQIDCTEGGSPTHGLVAECGEYYRWVHPQLNSKMTDWLLRAQQMPLPQEQLVVLIWRLQCSICTCRQSRYVICHFRKIICLIAHCAHACINALKWNTSEIRLCHLCMPSDLTLASLALVCHSLFHLTHPCILGWALCQIVYETQTQLFSFCDSSSDCSCAFLSFWGRAVCSRWPTELVGVHCFDDAAGS